MDHAARRTLEAINRRFYAERAHDFDASRSRPWQGFERALAGLPPRALRVLDLGCGNGRLLAHLASALEVARYLGVDGCAELIRRAQERYPREGVRFETGELLDERGEPRLPEGSFDLVALLGILHHVPSRHARRALVHAAFERVAPGGRLALTVWRFEHDTRLAKRALDWRSASATDPLLASLDLGQLEPGDRLLQWNKGARATRYCHAIAQAEIEAWLAGLGARATRFHADGGGELNEYVVLER